MTEKKWQGPLPNACDICNKKLIQCSSFIDGATTSGPWGNMCPSCFALHGIGIGPGRGQRYEVPSGIKLEG